MSVEQERLVSLIEFAQHSARLRGAPASSVDQHHSFALYEHELQGLPGFKLSATGADQDDEIWLSVERLHARKPPEVTSPLLKPWIQVTQSPYQEPRLLESTEGADLIAAGTHRSALKMSFTAEERAKPPIDPRKTVMLIGYESAAAVRVQFTKYLATWRAWAEEEKPRRKTIEHYSKLFTLKQQLEEGIVAAQLELVWGVGMGIWNCNGVGVSYPLITNLVELSLNAVSAALEIRPRDVDACLGIDWYAAVDNPGVADLEKAAKEFFAKATWTFSPSDPGTFEPLLRTAVVHLDANGVYWPDEVPAEDRVLPRPEAHLKVTNTWVLFARPRTNSLFIQDLEKFKKAAKDLDSPTSLPPAVTVVVTDPATENSPIELPSFRGVSGGYDTRGQAAGTTARDLYFPKPFNQEQVNIAQLLEVHEGVTVQGPPGTGKTHTIANVICHHLAEGKRVLVTSMKDPALAVLREMLPDEIRPLAISLLTSEQEGMKQFEHAIHKIASEVQGINRTETAKEIHRLEESIDAYHGRLALIDTRIGEWVRKNLAGVSLDGEAIEPQDAARDVVDNTGQFEWISDPLGVEPECAPQFTDTDVVRLREARQTLGPDIDYLEASLPSLVEFPDTRALLQVHQDLSQFEVLKKGVDSGNVPALADSRQECLAEAERLLGLIEELRRLREEVADAHRPWTAPIADRLRRGNDDRLGMLEALGRDLIEARNARRTFLKRPVSVPPAAEMDVEFCRAVGNLAAGKRAFGFAGLLGKAEQKRRLDSVRVGAARPAQGNEWTLVATCLAHLRQLRELALRWNALARELGIEPVPGSSAEDGLLASTIYDVYLKVKSLVNTEVSVRNSSAMLFPNWARAKEVASGPNHLEELDQALRHHLRKNRLAQVWVIKEHFQKVLEGRSGRIIQQIREFLGQTLGNPAVSDSEMQAAWSELMSELARVHGLAGYHSTVRDVCAKVEASGAPTYARALTRPSTGTADALLPDNWRKAWRLRRLSTHLESIDARHELKILSKDRYDVENDLARAYSEVVVKRTWLKLAENASPSIRSALQAYLAAIQKIGKGTGKRAVRYRQDARMAAAQANPAVPCWIMPHYRVSESLPAEFGCFDLVVIDEASQSDFSALPALLRARKALIVGDDKQVSPEGIGLEEEKVRHLMTRFLAGQVQTYRPLMSPERSIYDLFKSVFAKSSVMLKEHFRCVSPIIEYSKREFYNHELRPLRLPKASERIDPPLVDVLVEDGYRRGEVNRPEARFVVDEIKRIADDPAMRDRSIGVVSLIGDKQALEIWNMLTVEIGMEVMARHHIACGDARTFQGKERDIMFLSMVSAPNDVGAPLSRDTFAQRFNVAASRARDRMYLVRSVGLEHLSDADRLRRGLISHFSSPFGQDEARVEDLRRLCESPFERDLYDELTARGYWVTPQVRVGQYRIDMVVEGHNDARLAIECDGDKYHGADAWEHDSLRQRVLERAGWVFWRSFASAFLRRRREVLEDLQKTLSARGVEPIGAEGAARSVHTEYRKVGTNAQSVTPLAAVSEDEDTSGVSK